MRVRVRVRNAMAALSRHWQLPSLPHDAAVSSTLQPSPGARDIEIGSILSARVLLSLPGELSSAGTSKVPGGKPYAAESANNNGGASRCQHTFRLHVRLVETLGCSWRQR